MFRSLRLDGHLKIIKAYTSFLLRRNWEARNNLVPSDLYLRGVLPYKLPVKLIQLHARPRQNTEDRRRKKDCQ